MHMEKGSILDIEVAKLAFGGRGLARVDGFVIFCDRALPGQTVRAELTKVHKGFAEARLVEVLSASPDQIDPFCPHFGQCGGCVWQDLAYPAQLFWKREQLAESLRHLPGIEDVRVADTVASPETRRFRNKMEFAFAGSLHLGLYARTAPGRICDVTDCGIAGPRTMAMLGAAREFCRGFGQTAFDPKTGKGLWRHLVIRESRATGQTMVQLITAPRGDAQKAAKALCEHLTAAFPDMTTFVHSTRQTKAAVAAGERLESVTGPGFIEDRVGNTAFRISPDSFFQTNTAGAQRLYDTVMAAAALTGSQTVWDLYCGSGGIALYASAKAKQVIGVDSSAMSIRDAKTSAGENGIVNCEFVKGDVRQTVESLRTKKPDVVFLDPPRAGTHPEVLASLRLLTPSRIVYVSCNPATLARDAAALLGDYQVDSVTPVDMFPHGPHIECVLGLARRK
ncbi:23S rRNA (uracil(1939)-C(5))-methyltransferase RlmD [Desulfolutivibrio sulfoxidireducens]|uniref:23S rRNA (uracil(1939)-C(5))-methyltransferase RlmD n=1 Tax=Desulfolutivibrio sulfoxidireducens TaxID=2773299 RepID=UPI00159E3A36|nr:23S rRNA (uracil(1939)-C(5))-methyltransferase RlmD [Desulfolutivibrio sulfoxidireducens]QLA17774.1 23S rRNA (uracil(1939)-C(5))-methyltransferase RlmD [Desulfolutivibrio sulfoxidireducens]QLA21351.1 23S rRNA (uracil(1939)-C(5))-methyltransferase RlmD [Desulfolutivibrio sulfoxidireducens]